MKSLLQILRNRHEGVLPVPKAEAPDAEELDWIERAIAAVDAAVGSPEALAAAREARERRRAGATILFASDRSAEAASLGPRPPAPLSERRLPTSPEEVENIVDVFLSAHPPTRANRGAFAERMRTEVARRFDGDAPAFYRAAGVSRFQYSRLLSHPESFHPSKDTVLRMALAFRFSLSEAAEFLRVVG